MHPGVRPSGTDDAHVLTHDLGERGLDDTLDGARSGLALPPRERGTVVRDARPQPSFRQSTNSKYTIGAASPLRGPRFTIRV